MYKWLHVIILCYSFFDVFVSCLQIDFFIVSFGTINQSATRSFLHEEVMVNTKCTLAPCKFETGGVTEAIAVALLANHGISHQTPDQSTAPAAITST